MLPRYDITPHEGVGMVRLGMTRTQVRDVMSEAPDVFQKSAGGSLVDGWYEAGFQVFYNSSDNVEYIEVSRGSVDAWFSGVAVFETPAAELVRQIERVAPFDTTEPELGYSYVFPALELSLWRQVVPGTESDQEGQIFDTIGVGAAGYHSGAS